ncbi:hypothetical protein HYW32_04260 [Candidatus Berkelbacteria bacterium]|nr:hypothetical protein [Candidatus Berkelbacteria bacterium]
MPYAVQSKKTGDTYYLYSKEVTLRGGRQQRIFYFSRDSQNAKGDPIEDLPDGYDVIENARTGLPMLKRIQQQ